jgi:hypothetical protein
MPNNRCNTRLEVRHSGYQTPGLSTAKREKETLSTRLGDAGVSRAFASRCIQIVAMAMVMAAASHTRLLSAPRVRALAATMILLTHATPVLSLRRRSCIAPMAMGGGGGSSSRALRWRPLPSAAPLSTRRFRHADCANRSSSSVQVDSGVQVAEKQQQQEKESVVESRPPSFQQAIQRLQVSGV